jgi:hypothetical protein
MGPILFENAPKPSLSIKMAEIGGLGSSYQSDRMNHNRNHHDHRLSFHYLGLRLMVPTLF